jgi:hypothetical protein
MNMPRIGRKPRRWQPRRSESCGFCRYWRSRFDEIIGPTFVGRKRRGESKRCASVTRAAPRL